ncbi:MAG: Uma2 family endonuclease [Geminicoccaceae bacterium]|nr:MAG: Uma2 family endonuclease [Geminicoccaceae bacterium]
MPPAQPPRTIYDEARAQPEHVVAEVLEGRLHLNRLPGSYAALAKTNLTALLFKAFTRGEGGPGAWWVLPGVEVALGADLLVPDLAAWQKPRVPRIFDHPSVHTAPDWVCEIVTASTRAFDLADLWS